MFNSKNKVGRALITLAALFVLAGGLTALANSEPGKKLLGFQPAVKITLTGSLNREKKTLTLDKSVAVNSGEVLSWKMVSVNEGNADANNYNAVANVPNGTEYVAGSATGENQPVVTYSIDGGKSFQAQPLVAEKQVDGGIRQVPAPVSSYTQIRFAWGAPLASNQQLTTTYQVRVK